MKHHFFFILSILFPVFLCAVEVDKPKKPCSCKATPLAINPERPPAGFDPHCLIKRLKGELREFRNDNTTDHKERKESKERAELIAIKRNLYESWRMVQRSLALKNIRTKLPAAVSHHIASFMVGAVRYHRENEPLIQCPFATHMYPLLTHLPRTLSKKLDWCAFSDSKEYVYCIESESQILKIIALDTDSCTGATRLPSDIGTILGVEGSVPGKCIVMGSQKNVVWDGTNMHVAPTRDSTRPYAFSYETLTQLPPFTLSLYRNEKGVWLISYIHGAQNPTPVYTTLGSAENITIETATFGPELQRLMLYGKFYIEGVTEKSVQHIPSLLLYHPRKITHARFNDHPFPSKINGSLSAGNKALFYSHDRVNTLDIPSLTITNRLDFAPTIKASYATINSRGTVTAGILNNGGVLVQLTDPSQDTTKATLDIACSRIVTNLHLQDNRLLLRGNDGNTPRASYIDMDDVLELSKSITAEQADLYNSLESFIDSRIGPCIKKKSNKPLSVRLNQNQTETWESIPEKFRNNFIQFNNRLGLKIIPKKS